MHVNNGSYAFKNLMAVALLACLSSCAWADCTADVENEGARLSGHRFYTTWHVHHNAGNNRAATVFFEYRIHYRNQRGANLTESGVFNEYVRGSSAQFTKENTSLNDPVEILSVEYNRVVCRD